MLDKLKALEELQKVDVQILELLRGGKEHPKRLAEIESQLDATRAVVEVERVKLTEIEKQKKTTEEELAAAKDRVKKWEARLTEQRTTREYSALAREVDIAKKQNVTLQETIAELAKAAEEVRILISDKEAAQKDSSDALLKQAQEIRDAMADLAGARKALDNKRAEAAKRVDPAMLRKYDVIRSRRGTAITTIVGGACRGCSMKIPPQLNNELVTTKRIDICPSCGRIIYALEAFEPKTAAQP